MWFFKKATTGLRYNDGLHYNRVRTHPWNLNKMHPLALLVALMSLSALIFSVTQTSKVETITSGELAAVTGNMLVYRNAVAKYATNNPLASGSIADSALGLPTWYRKHASLGNYISTGRTYVFYTGGDLPGLVGSLHAKTESAAVGVNSSGALTTPTRGDTGIALPAGVPNQAVVLLQ